MKRVLLFGYGNPDREDDGVAWHVLCALASAMGLTPPSSYEDEFPQSPGVDFAFQLQLTPELADEISAYDCVCFFDAHTGSIPEAVRLIEVESVFQRSPLTHHLTPQSLLSICETLRGGRPEAALLSVLGHHFRFSRHLSAETAALVPQAAALALKWLADKSLPE